MSVSEPFSCVFKYTLAIVTARESYPAIGTKDNERTKKRSLAFAAADKESVLSHVCYTLNVHSILGNVAQVTFYQTTICYIN